MTMASGSRAFGTHHFNKYSARSLFHLVTCTAGDKYVLAGVSGCAGQFAPMVVADDLLNDAHVMRNGQQYTRDGIAAD
jgi:hypothetical protein